MAAVTVKELFGSCQGGPHSVLAPMVRAGTLPLRLLALHYGASCVFSEELIAKKLMKCIRVENKELGTVDFLLRSNNKETLVFQTCAYEVGRNVLQIGASNADEALVAAKLVENDVSGIDLNCGCPQHFSMSGGMGAALLSKPCVVADIVSALRKNLRPDISISCKIRLLSEMKATVDLINVIHSAGANLVTIHARRTEERPRDAARWQELETIIKSVTIPILVNGDVFVKNDQMKILEVAPSACGSMIARGAIADVEAAFSKSGSNGISAVLDAYFSVSELCSANFGNSKWFASQVIRYRGEEGIPRKVLNEAVARSKSFPDLYAAFELTRKCTPTALWRKGKALNVYDEWTHAIHEALSGSNLVVVSTAKTAAATTTTPAATTTTSFDKRQKIDDDI